jgi:hypothetical protein
MINPCNSTLISNLVLCLRQNIEEDSFRTCISSTKIDNICTYTYAYLGKLSKPKIKLLALSYAYKMQKLLNSKKKLLILSGGGVLRNKKLQKGSTLPLISTNRTQR